MSSITPAANATNASLALSGLASGIDWTSIVNELVTVERAPETQMNSEISTDQQKNSAYQSIGTQLTTLSNDLTNLSDPSFFDNRTTSVANSGIASATAAAATPLGTYNFTFGPPATDAVQQGTSGVAQTLNGTTLATAGFATPITAGTFTVNGQTITVATGDTLKSVFNQINSATGGAVTASYNASTDEISLNSSSPITLGSAGDTSNFLQSAQLTGNGTGSVSSASALGIGAVDSVSALTLSTAGFATAATGGTFTVNGKTITIATSDTLQSVFNQISSATGGAVTGSYDAGTDEIKLNSSSPIVLGSATDTSNFLQVAQLYNNGTGSISSTSALGGINLAENLASANFGTPISDGGAGAGEFLINGVAINFDDATDGVADVVNRINASAAGVTATYDSTNGSFELTSKTTGDVGISLQDVTGNFLAATGLTSGTLQHGTNLQYSINNGGTLTSLSNTIDATSAGIAGLSVTALGAGTTTISVSSDTSKISSAISQFVTDYNAVQNNIATQIKPTTDSSGNTVPGVLTGDMDAEGIADQLRQFVGAVPSGLTGAIQSLTSMGILSNGTDNTLTVSSTATLNSALSSNLQAVKQLFTNSTNGIATSLQTYVNNVNGSNGVLSSDEANMTKEVTTINASIASLESRVSLDQTRLTNEFVAMETAINSINTQKQFLNQAFSGSSSTSNAAPTAAGSASSG